MIPIDEVIHGTVKDYNYGWERIPALYAFSIFVDHILP